MMSESDSLKAAAERIRKIEDRLLENADISARAKERLVFEPFAYRQRPAILPLGVVGAAVAAAAAVLLMLVLSPKPITASIDGNVLAEGAWVSSSADEEWTLAFSDGSSVKMKPSSGVRLRGLTPEGAHLLLERGTLATDVTHRDKTDWKLDVGPYLICVVGTRFQVSWSPEEEKLDLKMTEGAVRIQGPMLGTRTVQAGETLLASLADGTVKINIADPSRAASPARDSSTPKTTAEVAPAKTAEPRPADLPRKTQAEPAEIKREKVLRAAEMNKWRALADSGQFLEALSAAKKAGIRKILKESSAADILRLGDAARHAGKFRIAAEAYKAARKRFAGSSYSSNAAFAMGIMAFDGQRDYKAAARWFSASLKDGPRGPLSREASGRLMEALRLSGDKQAAENAAGRYLKEYPNGPHAALARRLTQ